MVFLNFDERCLQMLQMYVRIAQMRVHVAEIHVQFATKNRLSRGFRQKVQ